MRLLFIYITSGLFLFFTYSCSKKNSTDNNLPNTASDSIRNTYLALGDSYTIGQSVSEEERFPNQTLELLKAQNINLDGIKYIATTGWTTGNLIDAINSTSFSNKYEVVSLLIGVNNQYQGRSLDEYKTQFTSLLNTAISLAGNKKNHVFVISIPDYSVTPFAESSDKTKIAMEIDEFNLANKNISSQLGVNYLDITPISREAQNDPSLTADDGLHPSGEQYKRWAALLAPLIKQSLKKSFHAFTYFF